MSDPLPRTFSRPIQFKNGCASGISNRWQKGQYCTILTDQNPWQALAMFLAQRKRLK